MTFTQKCDRMYTNRAEGKPQQTRKVFNMKNQIVYVVTDKASDTIVGVFNSYKTAEEVAYKWQEVKDSREEEVAVTPVAVDCSVDVPACYTFEDLTKALPEIFACIARNEFEDEDEDEDEEEVDEEEEEEEFEYENDEIPDTDIDPEVFRKIERIIAPLFDEYIPEMPEEEEEEEEEEDTTRYELTPKGKFVLKMLEEGIDFEEACRVAAILFDDEDGE